MAQIVRRIAYSACTVALFAIAAVATANGSAASAAGTEVLAGPGPCCVSAP